MIVEIQCDYLNCCYGFVSEMSRGIDFPAVRNRTRSRKNTSPKFILLGMREERHVFEGVSQVSHKMVLADATLDCFVAVVPAGLSRFKFRSGLPMLGSIIELEQYSLLRIGSVRPWEIRGVMFVHGLYWKQALVGDSVLCHRDCVTGEYTVPEKRAVLPTAWNTVYVEMTLIDHVFNSHLFALTDYQNVRHNGKKIRLHVEKSQSSYLFWHKLMFNRFGSTRPSNEYCCQCATRFGFAGCVVSDISVTNFGDQKNWMDASVVWSDTAHGRWDDEGDPQFKDLSPQLKRWCYHWYYAVNIYQHAGFVGQTTDLPSCFIDHVKSLYPGQT